MVHSRSNSILLFVDAESLDSFRREIIFLNETLLHRKTISNDDAKLVEIRDRAATLQVGDRSMDSIPSDSCLEREGA